MLFSYLEDVYLSFGKYLFHSLSTSPYHRQSDKRVTRNQLWHKTKNGWPLMIEIRQTPIFEETSRSKIGS